MTSTDPFTPERPFNTTLTDSRGDRWHFYYNGATSFRIKPHGARDWTNSIDLNYGLRPEDVPSEWRDGVTAEWLDNRAAEWIADRNDDIKKGNL